METKINNLSEDTLKTINEYEKECKTIFEEIDKNALFNQNKVLNAFKENRIALSHFYNSSGYGYDDLGKHKLCKLFATAFKAEAALVSPLITCGTHALTLSLFGVLRPKDLVVIASGMPYDTIRKVFWGEGNGSLLDFGVLSEIIPLKENKIDINKLLLSVKNNRPKMVYIQRSCGYELRDTFSVNELKDVIKAIKETDKNCIVMVDNCYGTFTDTNEPTEVGADIIAGSLIKNAGGGIAPTGGYVAGKEKYISLIGGRLTAPSVGFEVGSYNASYTPFFQGFFLAPVVVANALKGSVLAGLVAHKLGFTTHPKLLTKPNDLIRSITFNTKEELINFAGIIQSNSPVDSFAVPFPSDMPGYDDKVIMASGSFNQGSTMELSCDAPVRKPYVLYMQGGLTYEHIKIVLMQLIDLNK